MQRSYSCTAWHSENSAVQLYAPRRPRIMHVEFFVKIPTEIYPCMIHAHKMASRVEGTVVRRPPRTRAARPVMMGLQTHLLVLAACALPVGSDEGPPSFAGCQGPRRVLANTTDGPLCGVAGACFSG